MKSCWDRSHDALTYLEASSVDEALAAFDGHSRWIAGGTNLLDLMKENASGTPAHAEDPNNSPGRPDLKEQP